VERHFGGEVFEDEQIDRPALAQVVFNDASELVWLESLLHPHVKRLIDAWAREQEARRPRPPLLVAEVPLLFETDMTDVFDFILLVTAPEAARRKRLSAKVTASEFSRRAARQLPEADKAARCDFVVENVGGREGLRAFVGEVYASILAEGGRRGAAPPAH
jgi:dephospho-CoA kinase